MPALLWVRLVLTFYLSFVPNTLFLPTRCLDASVRIANCWRNMGNGGQFVKSMYFTQKCFHDDSIIPNSPMISSFHDTMT